MNGPVRLGLVGLANNDTNPDNQIVTSFAVGVGGTFGSVWDLPEGNAGSTLTGNMRAFPLR